MRRRILGFSFFPAFLPPASGGVERLYRVYSHLADRFDVTLISSSYADVEREVINHGPHFREIRVPKDPHFHSSYAELKERSGNGDLSGPAVALASLQFGAVHEEYLRCHADADVIIHDSPFLIEADLFRGFDGKPRVYQSYNFETGLYGGFHSKGDHTRVEQLVRDFEEETCKSADLITGCSVEDLEDFENEFAPTVPRVLFPNGFTPTRRPEGTKRAGNRLVFLGSGHRPNIEAAELIREKIAPRMPDFEFHLIGSCAPEGIDGNVISHGFVDQKTKHRLLDEATAAINPMASGSGSSLKVADIADHHLPLLSTPMGARGFNLEPGEHYISISCKTAAEDIIGALRDSKRLDEVAERSFQHFRERFTWEKIVSGFADQLEELCARVSGPAPRLVINDYDSFASVGGGATRTQGLCRGLSETSKIIFLTFADERTNPLRRVEWDGKVLVLQAQKTNEHVARHQADDQLHWVSSADIVNLEFAPSNAAMREMFRGAAAISSSVICEHPYLVGLPKHFGTDFVYSSQNFELSLKREGLADHPRRDELLGLAEQMEGYACGASSFIVAVSEEDAHQISGHYRFTAPILVIPNGSDAPEGLRVTTAAAGTAPTAVFMGSAHMPNIEAAQWIVTALAPKMPTVNFVVMGSVCDSLPAKLPANVTLAGKVSDEEKSKVLMSADVALNPMKSGSGSNIKMADFLQHGLRVISTDFGARGYKTIGDDDLQIVELANFESAVSRMLDAPEHKDVRKQRMDRFGKALSMDEGGRVLGRLLDDHKQRRKRALHVTYRYNDPPRGGGEVHVVRLVHALAKDGWAIDVVSPAAEKIEDVHRFGAAFSGGDFQPTPTGVAGVRSGKFPLDAARPDPAQVAKLWSVQGTYEEELLQALNPPGSPALCWGWGDPENDERWCFTQAAVYLPAASRVSFVARPAATMWLQIRSDDGELIHDANVTGPIRIDADFPAGFIKFTCSLQDRPEGADPRPLALLFDKFEVDGVDILWQQLAETWLKGVDPDEIFASHHRAQKAARGEDLRLSDLRVGSSALLDFIGEAVGEYDLVITHNAVFGVATGAIAAAKTAGVPSVFIPHLHFDDDFYHFPDVIEACAEASATLVAPRQLTRFLQTLGLDNVRDHGPGVDAQIAFTPEDSEEFRKVLGRDESFFLVLGRKAAAKGYKDVIAAAERMKNPPLIVLIGPDDDMEPIDSPNAIYLGAQPLSVVRGALRDCLGLVNMSRSESFGMVLVEAGLAGKPVLANRACAAFADLVEDGVNGFLVDADELPGRLTELASDRKLRTSLGEEARRRALEHDWTNVEKDFVALCNSLAKRP